MKLVYHDGTIGAIYFPVGDIKKGGSCQFASKKCIRECGLQSNQIIDGVYEYFKSQNIGVIVEQILKDLFYFPKKILYWFPSGDCPTEMQDKILKIMIALENQGLKQMGFTRNRELWAKANDAYVKLVLTVNTKKEALKIKENWLVAVPQFACWKADIYGWVKGSREVSCSCGGGWVTVYDKEAHRGFVSEEDCGICYDKKIGCWEQSKQTNIK